MKVAHIVCTFPPYYGGMGNVAFEIASGLMRLGHEVMVYTPEYGENESFEKEEMVKRLKPRLYYGNAASMPQLKKELEDFDIVHLHYPFFGTANIVRKWKLRNLHKKMVITYHMDTRAPSWKGLVFALYAKFWMPKVLGAADALIATSFDYIESSDARKIFQTQKKKWLEIPLGVDSDRFFPRPKPEEFFRSLGLDSENPTILFVGGMDPAHYFKGVLILLQAMSLLVKKIPEVQLLLVGDGELRENFENQAKGMGIWDSVRFVGRASDDELPLYYNMADIFVLPSIHQGEAFGMVLLEAMASGVPVIATDIAGVRSVALQGGMTVAAKDPVAVAESLLEYFSLPEDEQENWKKKARKVVEEKFSWDMVLTQIERLYKNLLEKK